MINKIDSKTQNLREQDKYVLSYLRNCGPIAFLIDHSYHYLINETQVDQPRVKLTDITYTFFLTENTVLEFLETQLAENGLVFDGEYLFYE